ncbi:MAG: response regulator [Methanobacteriota archaeon]
MEQPNAILVVDDEEDACKTLRAILEKEGYVVDTAQSGQESLEKIAAKSFDVILADFMMPEMDGLELLRKIKEGCPDAAKILFTAHGSIDSAIGAIRDGVDDYIPKPFDTDYLKSSIARVLEKAKLKRKLKESQEFTNMLINSMPDGVIVIDAGVSRLIRHANPSLCSMLKLERDEIVGRSCADVIQCSPCLAEEVLKTGKPHRGTQRFREGANFFDAISSPMKDSEGRISFVLEVFRDVTERKRMEEEIKKMKEFNENIVRQLGNAVVLEDAGGYITFANPKAEELLGCTKDESNGKLLSDFVALNSKAKFEEDAKKRQAGEECKFEVSLTSHDGREIPAIMSSTPLFEGEKYAGALSTFIDITEIKRAEEEMLHKAMKYRIEKGGTYLIREKKLEKAMSVFLDIVNAGFKGLILTRCFPAEIRKAWNIDAPILWMGEKAVGENAVRPDLLSVERRIRDFSSRNTAVLLDRLDYLITQNGFGDTLKLLQRLNEFFYATKNILLISLDPASLEPHNLSLIEKEAQEIELKYKSDLTEDLSEIFRFIHGQNREGKKPSFKELCKIFGTTRITVRKKVNVLKEKGLVAVYPKGRYKVLEITEKGRELLKY